MTEQKENTDFGGPISQISVTEAVTRRLPGAGDPAAVLLPNKENRLEPASDRLSDNLTEISKVNTRHFDERLIAWAHPGCGGVV